VQPRLALIEAAVLFVCPAVQSVCARSRVLKEGRRNEAAHPAQIAGDHAGALDGGRRGDGGARRRGRIDVLSHAGTACSRLLLWLAHGS